MSSLLAFYQTHGLLALFVAVFVEQAGAPIPSYPFLLLSGAQYTDSAVYAVLAVMLASLASLMADLLWFYAGRRYGQRILTLMCKISISPDTCVRKSELSFAKSGVATLLLSKFIPGLSTFAPPMAGALGMRLPTFLLFNFAGSLLWAGSGVALGVVFHKQLNQLLDGLSEFGSLAVLLIVALLALYIAYRLLRRFSMNRLRARIPKIQALELFEMMQTEPNVKVLDVRGTVDGMAWDDGIAGAEAVEMRSLSTALSDKWGKSDVLITFCACPNDASAVKAAAILRKHGLQAYVLNGGIEAWQQAVPKEQNNEQTKDA